MQEFDLMQLWRVLVKRRNILYCFSGTVIFFVMLFSFMVQPIYKPHATLLITEETSKMLNIEEELGFAGYRSSARDMLYINTQLMLLRSDSLAERVARKLNLLERTEFKPTDRIIGRIKYLVTFKWLKPDKSDIENELNDPYKDVITALHKRMAVSQVKDTKVLTISFKLTNPTLATQIVNAFAEEFIDFSIEKKSAATQQASDFLNEQIVSLREDLATKEEELQKYGKEKELYFLSDEENSAVTQLADLNNSYTQFQIERVQAESIFRVLRNATVDSLPRTLENRVLQTLQENYGQVRNEYAEKSKIYGIDHPEIKRLQSRIEEMRTQMQDELIRARDTAELEFQSTRQKENELKALLDKQREDVAKLNSDAIFYNSLNIEVQNKRRLLDSLGEKQNETLVSARLSGLKTSNISIIDKARIPNNPDSPKKLFNLLLAVLLGLGGGVGLCFVVEYLDDTIKGPEDLLQLSDVPSLGVIPCLQEGLKSKHYRPYYSDEGMNSEKNKKAKRGKSSPDITEIELVNHLHPQFFVSEDYRTIRTSILLSHPEKPPKTIAVSSVQAMDGKTSTVANMAVAFSQLNSKVLIIDADLRRPRLQEIFPVQKSKGLTTFLTGTAPIADAVQKTEVHNIWILPSGPASPSPAELLNSPRMKNLLNGLRDGFDFIFLDTPPVSLLADSLIVSSIVDATILVVQPEKTVKKQFVKVVERFQHNNATILGVIFNKAKIRSKHDYKNYYPYA